MLSGDRRWASTRKSGMTVLGKVPKPINLPSQRLENHGLDPNVEIVPKGTLTWGSKPSSLPSAWSSSTLISPNADGSSGSPSRGSGRPSSGGSGTRPSTAGSDKLHELSSNAWGPNSRPSSASGPLTSNQTSAIANRPRSAETRPGSSQLSRFAEALTETTGAWGLARTAERAGIVASKANEFSLSSGDFPSLSSDRSSNPQLQRGDSSHGRPISSSGSTTTQKEVLTPLSAGDSNIDAYQDSGNVNSWETDCYPHVGTAPSNPNWQRDHQQARPYSSGNVPAHQFIPWHNNSVHSPDGGWYKGESVNGPCSPAGPPDSYPIEPYAYYPQIPAGRSNSDHHSNPGAGLGRYNPKNADVYHHHRPTDSYMVSKHPVIPVRPGLYPSPVPYEGHYGPPHCSFYSSSQGEGYLIGAPHQPGVCDKPPSQILNLDSGIRDARIGGHGSVITKEYKKSELAHESHPGQYKVLLKKHDRWEDKDGTQEKTEQSVVASSPQFSKGIPVGSMLHEKNWRRNNRNDGRTVTMELSPGQGPLSQPPTRFVTDSENRSTYTVIATPTGNSSKVADVCLLRKPETATCPNQALQQNPAIKKNMTLIEKIESLNNKARSVDGQNETEERRKHVQAANKADRSTNLVSNNALSGEYAPSSNTVTSVSYPVGNMSLKSFEDDKVFLGPSESISSASVKSDSAEIGEKAQSQVRKRGHIMRGRVDDHSKVRSSAQDGGDFITKSPVRNVLAVKTKNGENDHVEHLPSFGGAEEVPELPHIVNITEASLATSISDPLDHNAQRAQLKEIAVRRAKELQEEEEERSREQKAKALAKLEELNRRTLAQSSKRKNINAPVVNDVHHMEEEERKKEKNENSLATLKESDKPKLDHCLGPDVPQGNKFVQKQVSGASTSDKDDLITTKALGVILVQNNKSTVLSDRRIETVISSRFPNSPPKDSSSPHYPSSLLGQENSPADFRSGLTSSGLHDSRASKQKQMGSKKQTGILKEEVLNEKLIAAENIGSSKNPADVTVVTLSDSLPGNEDSLAYLRKRSNRNVRSKKKLDEAVTSPVLPTTAPAKVKDKKGSTERDKVQHLTHVAEASLDLVQNSNSDPAHNSSEIIVNQMSIPSSDIGQSQLTAKVHSKMDNHWNSQSIRKSTRNQQAAKPIDKFLGREAVVWAPVKSSNRCEPSEVAPNSSESGGQTSANNEHVNKAKRTEMERYVPKPIAKELSPKDNSQQDNSREPSCLLDQKASGSNTERRESGAKNLDQERVDKSAPEKPDMKSLELDKPNRRGKMRASWRQCSSAESPTTFQRTNTNVVSDPTKPMLEHSDHVEPSNLVSLQEENFQHVECNITYNFVLTEKVTLPAVIKDQGMLSRQQLQQFHVQKDGISTCTPVKKLESGANDGSDGQSPSLDLDESDRRNVSRKKNHTAGTERMRSQWQPKYHVDSHHDSDNVGQGTTSEGVRYHQMLQSKDVEYYSSKNEKNVPNSRENGSERQNACNKEADTENKIIGHLSKEQIHSANKNLPLNAELAHASSGSKHELPVTSVPRRQAYQKNHFNRRQEAAYRGRDLGQDAGKRTPNMEGDRQQSNSRYAYQLIESYNEGGDSSRQKFVSGEAVEGSGAPGLKYRVRGQNHPKRGGHFYAQRGGAF